MTAETPRFDIDDPDVWLTKFKAHAEELQRQSQAAQERINANQTTVENKLMRMSLTSGAAIEEITFLTPAGRASATELTASFRELYAKAGAKIAHETLSIMTSLAGDDDPSLELIRSSVPTGVREQMEDEDKEAAR